MQVHVCMISLHAVTRIMLHLILLYVLFRRVTHTSLVHHTQRRPSFLLNRVIAAIKNQFKVHLQGCLLLQLTLV